MSKIRKLMESDHICEMFVFQDAFRVAVALWALSDGKTLSLQLLVGALEGDVGFFFAEAGWEIFFPNFWVNSEYLAKQPLFAHQKNGERNRSKLGFRCL